MNILNPVAKIEKKCTEYISTTVRRNPFKNYNDGQDFVTKERT